MRNVEDGVQKIFLNTSTTTISVLMGFLIKNTQNRDTAALQIKLDEGKIRG